MVFETVNNTKVVYKEAKKNVEIDQQEQGKKVTEKRQVLENVSEFSNRDEKQNKEVTQKQIDRVISEANEKMKDAKLGFEFSYYEKVNRVSIKVYNKDTGEVIKEIPPEKSLKTLEKIWEVAGILVDEKR